MRIASWNVEKLPARLGALRDQVAGIAADVLCLQEIGIRPSDAALIAAMSSALPVSRTLLPRLQATIEEPRFGSDHAPIVIQLD